MLWSQYNHWQLLGWISYSYSKYLSLLIVNLLYKSRCLFYALKFSNYIFARYFDHIWSWVIMSGQISFISHHSVETHYCPHRSWIGILILIQLGTFLCWPLSSCKLQYFIFAMYAFLPTLMFHIMYDKEQNLANK